MIEDKKTFVEDLSVLFKKHLLYVDKLEYFKPGKQYMEEVIITYNCGNTQAVNVSMDSLTAMLRDIARGLDV